MPVYVYSCGNCQSEFELIRPMAERNEDAVCPECGLLGCRQMTSGPHHHKYEMQAILKDGRRVKGHFGKSAPLQHRS